MAYSDTRIGRLFQLSWSLSPQDILEQARAKIKGAYYNNTNIERLQTELDKLYYPQHYENASTIFQNTAAKYRSEFIKKELGEKAVSSITKDVIESTGKFAGSKRESGERSRITIQNLEIRKEQIASMLQTSRASIDPKLVSQAEKLVQDLTRVLYGLEEFYGLKRGTKYFVSKTPTSPSIFIQMDEIYNALRHFVDLTKIEGEAFEREQIALRYIIENGIEDVTQEEIENLLDYAFSLKKNELLGNRWVKRDQIIDLKDISVQKKGKIDKKTGNMNWTISYKFNIGNEVLDLSAALGRRQGKVDIIYHSSYGDYYSSAKEWSARDANHDFGDTPLFHGMVRTGGINNALSYGLVISYYGSKSKLYQTENNDYTKNTLNLHYYAKACILIDTLLGMSQYMGGRADTLIINDKSVQHIFVYSISDLLKKVAQNLALLDNTNIMKGLSKFENFNTTVEQKLSQLHWKSTVGQQGLNQLRTLQTQMSTIKLRTSANILL